MLEKERLWDQEKLIEEVIKLRKEVEELKDRVFSSKKPKTVKKSGKND